MSASVGPGDLPAELTYSPVPLIALFGLQPSDNPDHALVWDGFTANRQPDRVPIFYKFCSDSDILTAPKAKKNSYEWYIPKGILRTAWIRKHLFEVPAVAVLFFDLDFDDAQWQAKEEMFITSVEQVRRQLNGRQARVAVVLIQRTVSLPGDQSLASERAGQLCANTGIPANCLFVLPIAEDANHRHGFFYRMEAAFAELAKSYYQSCAKVVRNHREQLNKTTHQLLFVRHQFKLGFYCELRQDTLSATKHYKMGYSNLQEIRASPNNLYEIKTVAGFLCYKISKLCFIGNFPLDAISHFKKHIDVFRSKVDSPDLEFEHKNWMSKQYAMFGSLFELAVATGLVPSQSQHPGFYYLEAATEAIARRKLALHLPKLNSPPPPATAGTEEMEYFGQRSWRPGCQAHETLDPEKEKAGIRALQSEESAVNHSVITISFLGSAITHFKRNRCPRLRRYMTILMAEEYFASGDYQSCLTALTQILPAYKQDQWIDISRSVLITCLLSAFHCGNGAEFVRFSNAFLDSGLAVNDDERNAIRQSVAEVNQEIVPVSLPKAWNVTVSSDLSWTFATESISELVSDPQSERSPLSFYVGSGCVRCRTTSAHEISSATPVTSQAHEPAIAAVVTASPDQITINGESSHRQEIDSHPVSGSTLLQVAAIVPQSGTSRTPIQITFTFVNLTLNDLPLELSIGNNDNFMFSGNKQIHLLIAAGSSQTQSYILYPLVCGFVLLPKLRLVAFPDSAGAESLDALVESSLPQYIQIMPKGS